MVPPPEQSPEVAVVLVLDRYIVPSAMVLIVPLLQAITEQYPRSKIRMASVTYDTMITSDLLTHVHWFMDYEQLKPSLQNTTTLISRFGLRPSSAPKGKGALLEALVSAMELLDMHTAQPFDTPQQPSAIVEVSHTRLRSFRRRAKPGHAVPPVHYVIALCSMFVDTGARAMKNRNPEFDGCSWGELPSKLKERSIFLSLLSTTPSERLAALHKEVTSNPTAPWWVLHPQFGGMQRLLAGYDTRTNVSKRSASDPDPSQSPSGKRARTNNPPHSQPSQLDPQASANVSSVQSQPQTTMPPVRSNGAGQGLSMPSNQLPQRPLPGQQPAARGNNRQQLARPLTLPPLPQPGTQLNAGGLPNATGAGASQPAMSQAGPGNAALGPSAVNHGNVQQQEWAAFIKQPNAANGIAVPARPNSVAAGGMNVKPTPTGGHSRSTSLQGAPPFINNMQAGQAMLPTAAASGLPMSMPDQQLNLQMQALQHARNQSNSSPFPHQIPNGFPGAQPRQNVPSSMPAPQPMPGMLGPGQLVPPQQWQPPPTPRPFPVDLNDRQSVYAALDLCCKQFIRQLNPRVQELFRQHISRHVNGGTTTSEDILKTTVNTLASILLKASAEGGQKYKDMHDRLLELSGAYWAGGDAVPAGLSFGNAQANQPMLQSMQPSSSSPPQGLPPMGFVDVQERQRAFVQKQQVHLQRQDPKLAQQTAPQPTPQNRPQAPPSVQMQPSQLGRNVSGSGLPNPVMPGQQVMGNMQGSPSVPPGQSIPRPPTTQPPLMQNQQSHMQLPQQLLQQGLPQQFASQMVVQQQPAVLPVNPAGAAGLPQQNGTSEKATSVVHQAFLSWQSDSKDMVVLTGFSILKASPDRIAQIIDDVKGWPNKLQITEWRPSRREELARLIAGSPQTVSFSIGMTNHPKMTPPQQQQNLAHWNLLCAAFEGGMKAAIVRTNPSRPGTGMALFSISMKMPNRLVGLYYRDTPIPDLISNAGSTANPMNIPSGMNPASLQAAQAQGPGRAPQAQMTPQQQALREQIVQMQQRAIVSAETAHQQNSQRQAQQPQQSQVQAQQQRFNPNFNANQGALNMPMLNMASAGSDLTNRNQQVAFLRAQMVQAQRQQQLARQAQMQQTPITQGNQDLGGMSMNAAFQNMFQQQGLNPGQQNMNPQNFNLGSVGMAGLNAGGPLPPPPFGQGQLPQQNVQQNMPQSQQGMVPMPMAFMANQSQQQQGNAGQMPLALLQRYMKDGEGRM